MTSYKCHQLGHWAALCPQDPRASRSSTKPSLTMVQWTEVAEEMDSSAALLPTPKGSLPFHSCPETLDHWTKPQEGLLEDPLTNPEEIWYTDGSNFVMDGKRRAGYAVVSHFETIEAKPLPQGTSVQLAELVALIQALELGKGKRVAIYTDSKYAFLVLHTCCYLERKGPLDHPRVPNHIW